MGGPYNDITPRQWRFVEEYLIDLNGTQAATRAGYAPESAHVTSSRLLKNANVAADIERLQRGNSYELDQMKTDVILGLKQIATTGRTARRLGCWSYWPSISVCLTSVVTIAFNRRRMSHALDS